MKKNILNTLVLTLATLFFLSGCVEHRYYHENHRHSDNWEHRHHHANVDVNIHN